MTDTINIPVKKSGFTIKFGGEVELWFDTSIEAVKKYIRVEELAEKELEKVKAKAEHVHFPKDEEVDEEWVKSLSDKEIDEFFELNNKFIAIQYDLIFGEGTFKKLYDKFPDIQALEETLEVVGQVIEDKFAEFERERLAKNVSKKNEILQKINEKKNKKVVKKKQ